MTLYAWGRGEDGQVGLGDTCDQYRPAIVQGLTGVTISELACGSGHTVVLSEDGTVFTWGRGDDGRLGHGDQGWKYIPKPVVVLTGTIVRHIACGSYHTAAISEDGELFTWGGGMYGKLGHGNETGQQRPTLVSGLKGQPVAQVTCGSRHTAALLESGAVYSWGDRENGVCGHGEVEGFQFVPKLVEGLTGTGITQVSACGFHTCALSASGSLYSWGEGKFGRLGHGNESNVLIPHLIESLRGVVITGVSCGGFHTAAVSDAGVTYSWGGGEHGQLGHGDKFNKMEPTRIVSLEDMVVKCVSCGWSHTVGLTDDGRVYTWGNGDHGKLGHGDASKCSLPKMVDTFEDMVVSRVVSYNEHTIAQVLTGPKAARLGNSKSFQLCMDLQRLLDEGVHADVSFVAGSTVVPAHKAILSARCQHFKSMFSSGMLEAGSKEIVWEGYSLECLHALLSYLYTDILDVTPVTAIELYCVADMYCLATLRGLAQAKVLRSLSVPTAAELFGKASEHPACSSIRGSCLKFIVNHFDAVSKSPGFESLTRELMLEIIRSR